MYTLTFASTSMDHTQGRLSALGSLVLTHGLIGPAVGGTDGFGLSPGAVEVALGVTVTYEKLDWEKKVKSLLLQEKKACQGGA